MLPSQPVGSYFPPLFPSITPADWDEEIEAAFNESKAGILAVIEQDDPAGFENTFLALESVWAEQDRRLRPFLASAQAHASEETDALMLKWEPRLVAQKTELFQNKALLERCRHAATQAPEGGWPEAEQRLIDACLRRFTNAGCELDEEARTRLLLLETDLSELFVKFLAACRKASAAVVVLESVAAVGLSEEDVALARQVAQEAGQPDGLGVVLQPDTVLGLLKKMEDRYSRRVLFRACAERGTGVRDDSTAALAEEILAARQNRAEVLGFEVASEHLMEETMAKSPDAALRLVTDTWEKLRPALKADLTKLKVLAAADGIDDLEPWDVPFYAEQYRQEHFQIDAEEISQYLSLSGVRQGAFDVARRVFGVRFERVAAQWYHPDVEFFEAYDDQSSESLGLLSIDDAIRPSKGSGAWMDVLRAPNGLLDQRPWVVNVCNFPSPSADQPALLSMDEAVTLFHELGHALHALCSKARYPSQAGTNVAQDFVELPSQILENWVREPESLKTFAKHWRTGETIPDELIEKHQQASRFGESFDLAQYLVSARIDLLLHSGVLERGKDLREFEQSIMAQMDVPPGISPRHRLSHFSHVFAGDDYAAGYYSYLWAEVLEASAFQRFREAGLFDATLGRRLRETVFEAGGSREPNALFEAFAQSEPNPEHLLIKRGLEAPKVGLVKLRK